MDHEVNCCDEVQDWELSAECQSGQNEGDTLSVHVVAPGLSAGVEIFKQFLVRLFSVHTTVSLLGR